MDVKITKDTVCRTVSGRPVKILCDDLVSSTGHCIVGVVREQRYSSAETVLTWNSFGECLVDNREEGEQHPLDLVADPELSSLVPNEPILVRNDLSDDWKRRHFAKVENDKILCWRDGRSIFTRRSDSDYVAWLYWKRHDETHPFSYFPKDIATQSSSDRGGTT